MVNLIKNRTEYRDIPEQCELMLIHDSMPRLGICELRDGNRLIVRNGGELLIPNLLELRLSGLFTSVTLQQRLCSIRPKTRYFG